MWKLVALFVAFVALITFESCSVANLFKLRESDKKFSQSFKGVAVQPVFHRYHVKTNRIRYVEMGSDSLPVVIFIHGSPASLSFWKPYFKDSLLTSRAKLVAVDRPGYGYSGFGALYLSYYAEAALLQEMLDKYKSSKQVILVGSSYGGPLAALMAAQNPDVITGAMLISSSIAPGEEATWGITRLIDSPWGGFFPDVLKIATAEKLNHKLMLEEIAGEWDQVRCPVIMFHGTDDNLIYPENANFGMSSFNNTQRSVLFMGGRKHDIASGKVRMVADRLIQMIEYPQQLGITSCKK